MRNPIAQKFYEDCLIHYRHRQDRHDPYGRSYAYKSLLKRRSMVTVMRHQYKVRKILDRIEAQARQACTERSERDACCTPMADSEGSDDFS